MSTFPIKLKPMREIECAYCKKVFKSEARAVKFCSHNCGNKFRTREKKTVKILTTPLFNFSEQIKIYK